MVRVVPVDKHWYVIEDLAGRRTDPTDCGTSGCHRLLLHGCNDLFPLLCTDVCLLDSCSGFSLLFDKPVHHVWPRQHW